MHAAAVPTIHTCVLAQPVSSVPMFCGHGAFNMNLLPYKNINFAWFKLGKYDNIKQHSHHNSLLSCAMHKISWCGSSIASFSLAHSNNEMQAMRISGTALLSC